MEKKKKPKTLKEALKEKLSKKELEKSVRSYDIIGSIAIIEIPKELEKKEKEIANVLLTMHKNITTVCKKAGIHKGTFRTQKLKILAGKRTKETLHKENHVRIKLNMEKVYFSPRLSTERKRIADIVKKGESILVMFSGCAPYPLVIAKNSEAKEIYGIEINPTACVYAKENIKLNKTGNIKLFCGDVKEALPKINKKFDRILMPLPGGGEEYLGLVLSKIKKNGVIHFYDFIHEEETHISRNKIKKACKETGKKCRILKIIKCGQYAARIYRICIDFRVLN